ncbi:hypothetical protein FQZ97_945090 [compost metagenome]
MPRTPAPADGEALSDRDKIFDNEEKVSELHRLAIATDEIMQAFLKEFRAYRQINIRGQELAYEPLSDMLEVIDVNIANMRCSSRDVRKALYG